MKPIEDFINKVICGDCITVMKDIPDNSIDTIITDPPYGLEFMGKEWDRLRNVGEGRSKRPKPAISGQEFKDRIGRVSYNATQNVRCRKCGHWKFSGTPCKCEEPDFPNIKAIQAKEMEKWHYIWAKEALRIAKPGATLMAFGGTRTYHRLACAIEDAGWIIKDCIMWLYGSGFPKSTNIAKNIKKQFNKTEKEWQGWGTHLKPAYEPIIVAMKPNDGTYAENALKWGVAGLNIDGGRIGTKPRLTGTKKEGEEIKAQPSSFKGSGTRDLQTNYDEKMRLSNKGRFPANLILSEESAELLDQQSGNKCGQLALTKGNEPSTLKRGNIYNDYSGYGKASEPKDNLGGASRFFYVAKASKSERNMGLEGFEEKHWNDGRKTPKDFPSLRKDTSRQNSHPTVKPLKLMEYLCLLTKTPTGGIVLDPFVGSGTTCMAAKKVGRDFIGIEREADYCAIARARIKAIKPNLTLNLK